MDQPRVRAVMPKMAADVDIRKPEIFADPDYANGETSLCKEEVEFFKENGFIIKRGLLDEKETFNRIVDYVWENAPRDLIKRDDPQTWLGAPQGEWTEEDVARAGLFGNGSWKMRSRDVIGREPFLIDRVANHPRMRRCVSAFIGDPVRPATRVRGIYGIFPKPPESEGRLSPHADQTAAQLSAMVFVDDVPPHCGGFTVWPGSHHYIYPHCDTAQGPIGQYRADGYGQARDRSLREITPVESTGRAGDVMFWHPRLLHSAGVNYSAEHDRQILRLVIPCDYQHDGLTYFDDLVEGPGPNHQWWVDTRNFEEDIPPTPENIWHGWAFDCA